MNAAKPWWRWRKQKLRETEVGTREAQEAYGEAVEALNRAEMLSQEVQPIMNELKGRREVNHFTELFRQQLLSGDGER